MEYRSNEAEKGPSFPAVACGALIFAALIFAFLWIESVLIQGLWRPFDIQSYYGLADSATRAISGVMDVYEPPPLLTFNVEASPVPLVMGMLALASACVVMLTGCSLYGRNAGLLAGLLFTLNIIWALSFFSLAEALALFFVVLSAYALLCMKDETRYPIAGLCLGMAVCFKGFTLLLIPVSLLVLYRRGALSRSSPGFIVGAVTPLLIVGAVSLAMYGSAILPAMEGGPDLVGFYAEGVGYRTGDALMAAADIALSICMLTSLFPLALLGFSWREDTAIEEYFLITGLCFIATLLLKQYLHYWLIALPFIVLLCASKYGRGSGDGS